MSALRYDVIAVNIASLETRVLARDKDARNAEAIIDMAVIRRGVKEEFYTTAPTGTVNDGEIWGGP